MTNDKLERWLDTQYLRRLEQDRRVKDLCPESLTWPANARRGDD